MRKISVIIVVLVILVSKGYCQRQMPVLVNGSWGYIDTAGTIIITPCYDFVTFFNYKQFAIVKEENKFGIIDPANNPLCKFEFDTIYHLFDDVFAARVNRNWRICSVNGTSILNQDFDSIISYSSYAKLYKSGKCGLFRDNGVFIPPKFDNIGCFQEKQYLITIDNKLGIIDSSARYVVEPKYDNIYKINDSLFRIGLNNKWGLLCPKNNFTVEPRWKRFELLETGYIKGYLDSLVQLLEYPANIIVSEAYYDYFQGSNDHIIVKSKLKFGIINRSGAEIVKPLYDDITYLNENYFIAVNNGKKGVINDRGDTIVTLEYDNVSIFENECNLKLFMVTKNKKIGLVDYENKIYIPIKFKFIDCREDGNFIVKEKKLIGLYSHSGKEIIPPKFNVIGNYDNNLVMARFENCYAIANKDTLLSKPINDRIIIASNVAKLYRDDTLEIITLEKNGSVFDRYQYNHIESYKVAANELLPIPKYDNYNYYEGDNNEGFEMRYSLKNGKWGIYNLSTQKYISDVKFDRIHRTMRSNCILTEIFTKPKTISFGGIDFMYNSLYGLVNMKTGVTVLNNDYVYIQLSNGDNKRIEYALHKDGSWHYVDLLKKNYTINYIDDNHQNQINRFHVEGEIEVGNYSKDHSLKYFNDFVNELSYCGTIWLKDNAGFKTYTSFNKFINCYGGKWSYINLPGEQHIRTEYRGEDFYYYAEPFRKKQSVVAKGPFEFGVQDPEKKEVIEFKYASIEPLQSESDSNSLYILSEVVPTYGYMDEKGKLKIDCQYSNAGNFQEGLAKVEQNKKWGYVNQSGEIKINCVYKNVTDFHKGVAIAYNDNEYGLLNTKGDTLFPFSYHSLEFINDSLFLFNDKKGYGVMSLKDDTIIPPIYKKPFEFNNNGFAKVKSDNGYGIIDLKNTLIIKDKYDKMGEISENNMIWVKLRNGYTLINLNNGTKIKLKKYKKLEDESCGLILFKKEKKYGYLNFNGKITIPESFKMAEPFKNGLAIVKEDKNWGVINKTGHYIIDSKWESIKAFGDYYITKDIKGMSYLINNLGETMFKLEGIKLVSEFNKGCAIAQNQENKKFYINTKGEMIIKYYYDDAKPFDNNIAIIKLGNKWGIIDTKGKFILSPKYYQIDSVSEGLAKIMISPLFGTCSYNGVLNIKPDFEELIPMGYNIFYVSKNNKIGYIKANGNWIWKLRN